MSAHEKPPVRRHAPIRHALAVMLCVAALAPAAQARDYHLPALGAKSRSALLAVRRTAEPPVPTRAMTLPQLTAMALSYNPQTQSAWYQLRQAADALGIARAAYWPNVSATISATHSRGPSGTTPSSYGPGVSVSYLLWDFGTRAGKRDAAAWQRVGAVLSAHQSVQDVMLGVEQGYYAVQGYRALVAAAGKSVTAAKRSLAVAGTRQKAGLATLAAVYQARAALAQSRLALQEDRGDLRGARGALAASVGLSPDIRIRLKPWRTDTPVLPRQALRTLMREADKTRPALLAAEAARLGALAQIRATRGQGLPSVKLAVGVNKTFGGAASHAAGGIDYNVGVTLSAPLFAGHADTYALAAAKAKAHQEQAAAATLRREVQLAIWQAYQKVRTDMSALATDRDVLDNARLAARVVRARYAHGLDTMVNLLTAQSTLANARSQRVQDLVSYHTDRATLAHAVGILREGAQP